MGTPRGLRSRFAGIVLVLVAMTGAGCARTDATDDAEMLSAFDSAVEAVTATEFDGPNETSSKDVTYLTGSGFAAGDPVAAIDRAIAELRADGWQVEAPTSNNGGVVVVADNGEVGLQIAAYRRVQSNVPPEGMSIVNIAVAPAGSGFAWTP